MTRGCCCSPLFGISLFVITAAAAGLYTLRKVGQTFDQLETVPMTLDPQELSCDAQENAADDQAWPNAGIEVKSMFGPAD